MRLFQLQERLYNILLSMLTIVHEVGLYLLSGPLETKFANRSLHHTFTDMIQVTNPILQSHEAIMECTNQFLLVLEFMIANGAFHYHLRDTFNIMSPARVDGKSFDQYTIQVLLVTYPEFLMCLYGNIKSLEVTG